jgi:hypothetical protein
VAHSFAHSNLNLSRFAGQATVREWAKLVRANRHPPLATSLQNLVSDIEHLNASRTSRRSSTTDLSQDHDCRLGFGGRPSRMQVFATGRASMIVGD